MKTTYLLRQTAIALVAATVAFTGCKKEDPVKVTGVTLDSPSMTLKVGESKKLTATVNPKDAADKDVTWSSLKSEVAEYDVATGEVKALTVGETTITVTTRDGGMTADCKVTVIDETIPDVPVESVVVAPKTAKLTLTVEETVTLTAEVKPDNATDRTVIWSSETPSIATVDAATGAVKAIAVGTATITATCGGKSDYCTVTVEEAPVPTMTLTVEHGEATVFLAGSGTATINWGDNRIDEINLSAFNEKFADGQARIHQYAELTEYNIIIEGLNVTHLACSQIKKPTENNLKTIETGDNAQLVYLNVGKNANLTKLDVTNNRKLEYLNCESSKMISLDVSQNVELRELICPTVKLQSLDVSNNPALEYLACLGCELTSLNLTKNPNLKILYCNNNALKSLDVSKNPLLEELFVHECNLTELSVTQNPALILFDCNTNSIARMDVSNCPKLQSLGLDKNPLTELNVSNNTDLATLWLEGCQLTSLDLSHCPKLVTIDAKNNKLTGLNVTVCTQLKMLNVSNNQFDATSTNAMYNSLNDRTDLGVKIVYPSNLNIGDKTIATGKGWMVF